MNIPYLPGKGDKVLFIYNVPLFELFTFKRLLPMRTAKKMYFTINEITLELKGPYARLELFEIINVSYFAFRMRFNKSDKVFHPKYIHTPINGFYIIRDNELDTYKNAANFIKASRKILEDFRKAKELNSKDFDNMDSYERKLKYKKKVLKSDIVGKIPRFKMKTLNIYTAEVTRYENIKDFSETENYLLADILECIENKTSPIFQGKFILAKHYPSEKEFSFRAIDKFENEIYFPNRPVILETNIKTNQQRVYAGGIDLCKHIPFDVGEVMFSLRYEGGFTFNEYFYRCL